MSNVKQHGRIGLCCFFIKEKDMNILFIGNSYTYYNELWNVFQKVAESAGYSVTVEHVCRGGYYLDQFLDLNDPAAVEVAEKLDQNKYDYVCMQEQSANPILNYKRFANGAGKLHEKIQQNGAKAFFYQTWGRKTGSELLAEHGWTNQSMTEGLKEAYVRMGKTLDIPVSPVGSAFYAVYTNYPEIELYDPDKTHPALAGTYLAALCHFSTLMGEDPMIVTYDAGLGEDVASILKKAAKEVCL